MCCCTNGHTRQRTDKKKHKIIVMLFKRDFGFLSHISHPLFLHVNQIGEHNTFQRFCITNTNHENIVLSINPDDFSLQIRLETPFG
nr:MAG TPA: hypothetical protein [Caudoviricetes sp.]